MASHGVSWVLSVHMCFENLDFIIMMEGELALAPATIWPLHSLPSMLLSRHMRSYSCTL